MAEEPYETLDNSGKDLKKISKASENEAKTLVTLILDNNDLQRLDCVDSYSRLENLSVSKNGLLRMHGVSRLTSLRQLNLSNNSILTIEGLKDLIYLKKLYLSGNNIKSIEHLNNNIHLEDLDLSDNQISHISDISCLKHLKNLHLEKNRIGNLKQCERYLPSSLVTLGLAHNFLTDMNTLCHLGHLNNVENFNIEGNPCVSSNAQDPIEFDYRPFVINWVMSVKVLDGYEVNAIESLKAEWLYSQGRGRQFREGENAQLVQYLVTTCPLGAAAPETEEQRKLRLILSKAQHHQQQLREQGPSPPRPKQSPRMHARITGRVTKSPDRAMSSSYHSALSNKHHNLLTQQSGQMSASFSGEIPLNPTPTKLNHVKSDDSFGSAISYDSSMYSSNDTDKELKLSTILTSKSDENNDVGKQLDCDDGKKLKEVKSTEYIDSNKALNQPLEAASKMVPVPDSMMSPDYQGPMFTPPTGIISTSINKKSTPMSSCSPLSNVQTGYIPHQSNNITAMNQSTYCESPNSMKSGKTPTKTNIQMSKPVSQNIKNNKGSPQLPRSAMSSPKMRHCADKRKGSFSSRTSTNTDDLNQKSTKQLYNQAHQNSANTIKSDVNAKTNRNKKSSLANQTEIQITPPDTKGANSSDDDSEMCVEKLQSIRNAANQRRKKQSISDSGSSENVATNTGKTVSKSTSAYNAAVLIQKLWRGYRTRNLNHKTGSIMHSIQTMRARQYIEKLSCDMEATKAALDSERKIQQLQMQAINALWKRISAMESSDTRGKGDDKKENCKDILPLSEKDEKNEEIDGKDSAVRELTQTCSMLQAQVQQLQGSMRDILQLVSSRNIDQMDQSADGVATQTEITAVHTPQGDNSGSWPYQKLLSRPCSLSLTVQNNNFKLAHLNGGALKETHLNDIATETLPGQVDQYCMKNDEINSSGKQSFEKSVNTKTDDMLSVNGSGNNCDLSEMLVKDCIEVKSNNQSDNLQL